MKKIIINFLLIMSLLVPLVGFVWQAKPVSAVTEEEIEKDLEDGIDTQLSEMDFSALDKIVEKLASDNNNFFGSANFLDKIKKLISGEFVDGYDNLFKAIINLIFSGLISFLPLLCTIIVIAVLSSLINSIKPLGYKGVGDLIHFVCFGVVVILLVKISSDFIFMTVNVLNTLKAQMDVIFPILLTLMLSIGGVMSAKIYQPVVLILSNGIIQLVTCVLLPIVVCMFIFSILNNISNNVKLSKFSDFFSSLFKWLTGGVFTVFMGFLSLQGILAGIKDGISIKTAKYAIRSYIPVLGGFLSEGFDVIVASSVLIKNAVGVGGILLLIATVVAPIIKIAIFSLGLKLVAAIIEPICDSRIHNFVTSVSKIMTLLIVCILAVSFTYLIVCALIMFTANAF